jgi:hypothetical protein
MQFRFFLPCALFAVGVAFASPSPAQDVKELTDENVRAFIEKVTHITTGKESEMTDEEITAYLDTHLHPEAKFKSVMRYAVPGFDMQEKTMSVDKQDFIASIHQATDTMDDYESDIKISDINISGDGRKATLKTQTMESGMMPVRDEIEMEEVPVEGFSNCTQTLMLSDEDVIQMYNATCVTEIQFQMFDP